MTTGTETMTIERAVHRYNFLPLKFPTKDRIIEDYNFIKFPIDKTKFKALNMNLIESVLQKYDNKRTTIQLEEEKEKECETLLNNNVSNYTISTEWLSISKLTKDEDVPANLWREIKATNGDSFYVCFVYLLFSEVIIRKRNKCLAIQFDILENFKANLKAFYQDIDLKETQFVLKQLLNCNPLNVENNIKTFDRYFNIFGTFVKEMTLYLRYCLYRCMKDLLRESFDFLLEEGTEPFPREEIFEILSRLFNVNLIVKFTEKGNEQIIQKGSINNIEFCILHFGGRYHLYSHGLDLNTNHNSTLHNNLTFQTENILTHNNHDKKTCECDNVTEKILYQSEFSSSLVCKKCLETHISTIMSKRVHLYCKNNRYNKEMYLSPIYVNEQTAFRDVVLSNVFKLQNDYQSYLSQVFETIFKRFCCECNTYIEREENSQTATCGCVYDNKCASKMIDMNFDNFFLRKSNNLSPACVNFKCKHCEHDSSLTLNCNISTILTDNKKAEARKLFISYCINCKVTISSKVSTPFNNLTQTQGQTNYKCQLKPRDTSLHNQLFPSYYHFLCSECAKENVIVRCAFCNKMHEIIKEQLISDHYSIKRN